jgi:Plasmid pRiA4b ORF-3-like protein
MATKKIASSQDIYQIKVTLLGTKPPFGDSWEHAIVLEKQLPVDPNASYPICTDGQLACPPDDCGGIPGFYDLVEAIAKPNHEQQQDPNYPRQCPGNGFSRALESVNPCRN